MNKQLQKLAMLVILTSSVWARADFYPALREENVPYHVYEQRALLESSVNASHTSALRSARLYPVASLPKAINWNKKFLMARFKRIRDERFLSSSNDSDLLRRPSWLYPDDGCYARAAMAIRNSFQSYFPVPQKIFAFGHLRVKTPNSPRGRVGWWYHVAPIVEVEGEKMILDPAIEPLHPLTLLEWLTRMGKPERIKVSLCGSGTYSPGDNCHKETDGLEIRGVRSQKHYLNLERERLRRMGRSAERELGDQPPWITEDLPFN